MTANFSETNFSTPVPFLSQSCFYCLLAAASNFFLPDLFDRAETILLLSGPLIEEKEQHQKNTRIET